MNSLSVIKVSLEIDDFYFRIGLKFIVADFFYKQKQEVFFVSDDVVDLVVRSEAKPYMKGFYREIIIRDKILRDASDVFKCNCKSIFFKNEAPEEFISLLQKTMCKEINSKTCFFCRRCLTRREREILQGYADGLSTNEIANAAGLHIKSVSQHKRNAMRKLFLRNTKELVEWLAREKISCI
ncbi:MULTISPECIES: helix-turn-helix transcriptional regulator [Enterobacter cloacae complex]|uniref:response regulator transcription factor n=1 Tax=Enterobacter cloacae complex TaxID=354276 RepID=UPI0030765AA6